MNDSATTLVAPFRSRRDDEIQRALTRGKSWEGPCSELEELSRCNFNSGRGHIADEEPPAATRHWDTSKRHNGMQATANGASIYWNTRR